MIYILSNKVIKGIKNLNLLNIEFKKIDLDIEKYDILIFTSKNAVLSVKDFIKNKNCFAIGNKTAEEIKKYGGKVNFIASKYYGHILSMELKSIKNIKDKKLLYIRPKIIASTLTQTLKDNNFNIDEIITYQTNCATSKIILDKNAKIIFSSPSTVKCFFKNYKWIDTYQAFVIGNTTAKSMPKDIKYKIADKPTFDDVLNLIYNNK